MLGIGLDDGAEADGERTSGGCRAPLRMLRARSAANAPMRPRRLKRGAGWSGVDDGSFSIFLRF